MFVIKYVTVLSGKYPANFTRISDSAGCLHFTGYRIVLSGSGTSLIDAYAVQEWANDIKFHVFATKHKANT